MPNLPRSKPFTALDTDTGPIEAGSAPADGRRSGKRRAGTAAAQRRFSPLTRRILAVNMLALGSLVAGMLYLGQYRQSLIDQELLGLRVQADMFAIALAESAVSLQGTPSERLLRETAIQMVRRLVESTGTRARLFAPNGALVADSHLMQGLGGLVQVDELPPLGPLGGATQRLLAAYDHLVGSLFGAEPVEPYREKWIQGARDYDEVTMALTGHSDRRVRSLTRSGLVLSVAVPIQRYKQVLGAVMLSKGSQELDEAVYEVRVNILRLFAGVLFLTVLLSFYLAGTVVRPIRRLALAAERIRRGQKRASSIPDLGRRDDEIGDLAVALREMTEELWTRMDATERFAADVAHEIKNPLTSLRSAVETAARLKDPEHQQKLMSIIQEDVVRLDRLISDISDASRLDAELSRAEVDRVDLSALLETLADIHGSTQASEAGVRIETRLEKGLFVQGIDSRLAQVFRNLLANALSFSPKGGTIFIEARAEAGQVVARVSDEGPGIPEGKEERIFQRFYTERPEGEKFGTHSGLGLNISQQIVAAHGGDIAAANRKDGKGKVIGAAFTVRLPAERQAVRRVE